MSGNFPNGKSHKSKKEFTYNKQEKNLNYQDILQSNCWKPVIKILKHPKKKGILYPSHKGPYERTIHGKYLSEDKIYLIFSTFHR